MSYKFTKSTNEYHEEKLESQLIYAIWKQGVAYGGSNIELEVRTSFVGEGAEISIKVLGSKSKKILSFEDLIFGNKYHCAIPLPTDLKIDEDIWFEVKLKKQKLNGKSNKIPASPIPKINAISWNQEEARKGDILNLTAELENIRENSNVTVIIYEYDNDGTHDIITKIPTTLKGNKLNINWEYQYHEDVDEIPTQTELEEYGTSYNPPEYFFVIDAAGCLLGMKQESGILKYKEDIKVLVKESNGTPVPDAEVEIHTADGEVFNQKSDENGFIELNSINPGKVKIILK